MPETLNSFVFARRSEGVAWHLQGRLTREQCAAHRKACLDNGWDVTVIKEITVTVDLDNFERTLNDVGSEPKAGC